MKILVISVAGIGDSLLATPLIRALREQFPDATIDALVMWAGAKDLLENNPCLHTIYQQNFFKESALSNLRFLWRLREGRYDISINTYPQSKIHYRFIARLINAQKRLGHRYKNHSGLDGWLTNLTIPEDYTVHCIENNLNLLKLLGVPLPAKTLLPEIFLSAEEKQWAEDFTNKHRLKGRTLAAIHVGSGKTKNLVLKRWPIDSYIALIQRLLAAYPSLTVLLFGGPEEREDNEKILEAIHAPEILPVASRTMRQASALLKTCDLFLSVDNAFMHLGAAMKVPRQIVIESPTFNKTIEPYQRPFRLVPNPMVAGRNLHYYRYDGRDIQGTTEHLLACMRSISPQAVFERVQNALAEKIPGDAAFNQSMESQRSPL